MIKKLIIGVNWRQCIYNTCLQVSFRRRGISESDNMDISFSEFCQWYTTGSPDKCISCGSAPYVWRNLPWHTV